MSKVRNILDEMEQLLPRKDKHLIVEARANHIITSAINLLELINENFSAEEADELSRRLLLAIKNSNPQKFNQGIKKIRESNENKRS